MTVTPDPRPWYTLAPSGAYVTTRPLRWELGRPNSTCTFVVPRTFHFDVSVPSWAAWLFDPHDKRFLRAACLHDWLLNDEWDRLTAGAVFASALKREKVASWKRFVMWFAVSVWKWS